MTQETREDILKDFAAFADMEGLDYAIEQGYIDETRLYGIDEFLANVITNTRTNLGIIQSALSEYMP